MPCGLCRRVLHSMNEQDRQMPDLSEKISYAFAR
jgi:cytidine deaminase